MNLSQHSYQVFFMKWDSRFGGCWAATSIPSRRLVFYGLSSVINSHMALRCCGIPSSVLSTRNTETTNKSQSCSKILVYVLPLYFMKKISKSPSSPRILSTKTNSLHTSVLNICIHFGIDTYIALGGSFFHLPSS